MIPGVIQQKHLFLFASPIKGQGSGASSERIPDPLGRRTAAQRVWPRSTTGCRARMSERAHLAPGLGVAARRLLFSILLLAATAAGAHHFKGLPHFSYFENYPQIPQDEFLGQAGQYEFSLVLYDFQGLERQDVLQPDDARLFLVVFNLLQNKVYSGPARLEILDRGEPVITARYEAPEQENIYQVNGTLPSTGKYTLRVTLVDEQNLQALIPFQLSSQKISWGKWVGIGLACLIAIAAAGARRARIVQDRKRRSQ